MKKLQTCILFRSNRKKLCLCLFIVLFSEVTTLSNFQATFPLISPEAFGKFTPNFTTKVRKIRLNFWYQNHSGFEKNGGMMLWIMSGTFKAQRAYCGSMRLQLGIPCFQVHQNYFVIKKKLLSLMVSGGLMAKR